MPAKRNKKTARRRKPAAPGPLLSHSSILILSGFLIGVFSQNVFGPEIAIYVLLAGAAGMSAYFGLGLLARRQRRQTAVLEIENATLKLASRIDRHVPRRASVHLRRTFAGTPHCDEQYVTVVRHSGLSKPRC